MLRIAYTITPEIRETLTTTEAVRHSILTTPIPPAVERTLRWEAWVRRLYHLQRSEQRLTKSEIATLLIKQTASKNGNSQILLNYKHALEFIYDEWFARSYTTITLTAFDGIQRRMGHGLQRTGRASLDGSELKNLLDYLQTQEDDPIIAGAIAYSQLAILSGHDSPQPMSFLFSYLFVYYRGLDVRSLLCLEPYIQKNQKEYTIALQDIKANGSSNMWLSFFARGVASELEYIRNKINDHTKSRTKERSFDLNDRQREILTLLDGKPHVNNAFVQHHFGVSQITASRDLSGMASLGLLVAAGKGRSTTYRKV